MAVTKSPWKDRIELLRDISSFVSRNGGTFKQNAKRMSDLLEMSVFNDVLRYYRRKRFNIQIEHLGANGLYRYKLTTSGLAENFSHFLVTKGSGESAIRFEVHQNIKVQSHHHARIYFTADVTVTEVDGVRTVGNGRKRHSFVEQGKLITFFEAKNMNPFPEVLFGFSGIVLEVLPDLISGKTLPAIGGNHLMPCIVFSGTGGDHVTLVATALKNRYSYNVISGLYANKGQMYSFKNLNEFK